jgi:hypothetical protein
MADLIAEIDKIYQQTMGEKGSRRTNLLGVLEKGMGHNGPSTIHLCIFSAADKARMPSVPDEVIRVITYRVALVQRHMNQAQDALRKIHEIAKKRDYKDIIEVFERDYFVGHAK